MRALEDIEAMALKHHTHAEIEESYKSHKPKTRSALAKIGDDRWLAQFTESIFKAGFNWKVIEAKWAGFEAAFHGFDVRRCAMLSDDDLDALDALAKDARIVRNPQKILSVRDNAVFLKDLAAEHGSAAKCFAEWPDTDYVGLVDMLGKRGSRLGGATAMFVLRFMGKPAFILSPDVVKALMREGVVDKEPKGKGAMKKVQAAFNQWAEESGKDLTYISRLLAMSVG